MRSKYISFPKLFVLALIALSTLQVATLQRQASAQISQQVVNPSDAKRLGMVIQWRTQVNVGTSSNLQNIAQVFGKSKKLVKYVVTFQDVVEEFYEDDNDRFGREIGVAGAQARAEARLQRYKSIGFDTAKMERIVEDPEVLKTLQLDLAKQIQSASGFEKGKLENQLAEVEARRKRLLPAITLLAQSTSGSLHSIDGRTGKTNWIQQIGKRNHPSMPVVAKRDHFAVVNASQLYCGLLKNGRVVWDRNLRGAPGSQAAMTRRSIYVPMIDGFVEQFVIRDGNAPTGDISSIGLSLLGATSSDNVVAWPSDRGELNVAFDSLDVQEVSYRLVPKRKIISNAAFQEPYMFATSTDGSIYCLKENSGQLVWDLPTGIPISNSPFPLGKYVYFVNNNHVLNQVEIETGIPIWERPGLSKVICGSANRLYCLDRQNQLVVLDVKTGSYMGTLTDKPVEFVYQNNMTDRLIVGNHRGLIQCLREVDQVDPLFHLQPEVGKENKAEAKTDATQQPGKQQPNNTDPFGGNKKADDPFGGGVDDPFGGGGAAKNNDDPFGGGGGAKNNDDPFGGGGAAKNDDDPFGN